MNFPQALAVCLSALMGAAACEAGIISKSLNVQEIPIPADVRTGFLEDQENVVVFQERETFALPVELPLNFTEPGLYGKGVPPVFSTVKLPVGTRVDSYYVHFDPVTDEEAPADIPLAEGTITFDAAILGLIVRAGTLTNTNSTVGLEGSVLYSTGDFVGMEFYAETRDYISISDDRRTITFGYPVGLYADNVRVITAVPEISAFGMMAWLTLLGLAGSLWRRGRSLMLQS